MHLQFNLDTQLGLLTLIFNKDVVKIMSLDKNNEMTLNGIWIANEVSSLNLTVCPFDISLVCNDSCVNFHKIILGSHSKLMHSLLSSHDRDLGEGEHVTIILPDFESGEAKALFELLYKGLVESSRCLFTRLEDLTKILNFKPFAVSVGNNEENIFADGLQMVEDLLHSSGPNTKVGTTIKEKIHELSAEFGEAESTITDEHIIEKYDALLSVGNEVFNAPIDEAAALQLINELYRNDGDAEHILDRFFKNLPEDITFSRSHFEEISIALRTPHECPEPNCDAKDFKKDTDYTCHMKEAHGVEKSFKCPQCKHSYKFKSSLKNHLYSHQPTSNFSCRVCSKTFKTRDVCLSHEKLHGGRQFKCKDCNAAFKQRHVLSQHRKIRHEPKRFSCDLCEKKFGKKQTLDNHKLIHTGELPHHCRACNVRFRRRHHMKLHIQTVTHATKVQELKSSGMEVPPEIDVGEEILSKKEIFTCDICPEKKTFHSFYHLQKHKQSQAHLDQMMRHRVLASESVSVTQDFAIGLVDEILGESSVVPTTESTILVDDHGIFILSEDTG